jgi:4-hydroxyphenylacetate 3-monooxygenase
MRTGKDYLSSLADGRTVFVNGEKVEDVTTHPAFEGVANSVAELFDVAADPASGMTYTAPETGNLANAAFMIPRTREDLARRRSAISTWAKVSRGFLGRSPDHVAGFYAGFASAPEVFDRGDRSFGDNVTRCYRRLLDESRYASYVIIPPQVDRSTTAAGWDGELIQVGVLDERDDGIVVRGSQMLGTGSAVSDEIFVSCIKPLGPDDERYALSFVVPTGTPGVRLYCRRPYALGQPSTFDYPLSTRFDESDALVVFDDVFVPWEDVFVYRDPAGLRDQFFATAAHVLGNTQAQIRLVEKLRFIIGIARKVAQVNQIDKLPPVQEKLGDLASIASIVEGMVLAAESAASPDANGVMRPNSRFLYAPMGLQAELYPRVIALVRELVGGGVIQLPSSFRELVADETRGDIERYIQSPGYPSEERVKLFKLAWDVVGSEFGGRHQQYEMFYAGAPFVAKGYAFRNYGYDEAVAGVDEFLAGYSLESARR